MSSDSYMYTYNKLALQSHRDTLSFPFPYSLTLLGAMRRYRAPLSISQSETENDRGGAGLGQDAVVISASSSGQRSTFSTRIDRECPGKAWRLIIVRLNRVRNQQHSIRILRDTHTTRRAAQALSACSTKNIMSTPSFDRLLSGTELYCLAQRTRYHVRCNLPAESCLHLYPSRNLLATAPSHQAASSHSGQRKLYPETPTRTQ